MRAESPGSRNFTLVLLESEVWEDLSPVVPFSLDPGLWTFQKLGCCGKANERLAF
jgi:hypothetical protein